MEYRESPPAGACSLERVVRPSVYRGASGPPELKAWTPGGANEGAAAGKAQPKRATSGSDRT